MATLSIISGGSLSTIQDLGRIGFSSVGFSPNGAMDTYSMKLANLLVSNPLDTGVIEMTFLGIHAVFKADTVIALTGADMEPMLNGAPIPMYSSVEVHHGDELVLKYAKSGLRTYLAVSGGFDVIQIMGSASTDIRYALGGFEGRKLRAGDEISLNRETSLYAIGKRSVSRENRYNNLFTVRVIMGPQDDCFGEKGIETFFSSEYTVSPNSDRMGIRLEGEAVESLNGVDIISDGVVTGSVQIPASGSPIIMMADRQTTGGYAKLATVISVDLSVLAQARPGDKIRFERVTLKEALRLKKKEARKFKLLQYKFLCASWRF